MAHSCCEKARKDIKRNDTVEIMVGKDRGKTGVILKVLREQNRAVVEKINLVKRHSKPNAQLKQGGIIEKEATIHLSNLKKTAEAAPEKKSTKSKKAKT